MNKPLVYLGGPVTGSALSWRQQAIDELERFGIVGVNPMRGCSGDTHASHLAPTYAASKIGVATRNFYDISRVDAVLVNLTVDQATVETGIELGWADALRKPVILIETPTSQPADDYPDQMVADVANFIVPTVDDAIECVVALLSN